jgi:mannose-6-phosphate isomerase-like protein (cupin superfamily)
LEIQHSAVGTGTVRRSPFPNGPLVEVLLNGDDSPVGAIHVRLAAGAELPEHDHGPSTVVLIPRSGTAQLVDVAARDRTTDLRPGTVTTIPVGRRVRLRNPGDGDAELLVVVSPAEFARGLTAWPAVGE